MGGGGVSRGGALRKQNDELWRQKFRALRVGPIVALTRKTRVCGALIREMERTFVWARDIDAVHEAARREPNLERRRQSARDTSASRRAGLARALDDVVTACARAEDRLYGDCVEDEIVRVWPLEEDRPLLCRLRRCDGAAPMMCTVPIAHNHLRLHPTEPQTREKECVAAALSSSTKKAATARARIAQLVVRHHFQLELLCADTPLTAVAPGRVSLSPSPASAPSSSSSFSTSLAHAPKPPIVSTPVLLFARHQKDSGVVTSGGATGGGTTGGSNELSASRITSPLPMVDDGVGAWQLYGGFYVDRDRYFQTRTRTVPFAGTTPLPSPPSATYLHAARWAHLRQLFRAALPLGPGITDIFISYLAWRPYTATTDSEHIRLVS